MVLVVFAGVECNVVLARYAQWPNVGIVLRETSTGMQFAIATRNIEEELGENICLIRDSMENAGILQVLLDAGIVEPAGDPIPYNFLMLYPCKLTERALVECERFNF